MNKIFSIAFILLLLIANISSSKNIDNIAKTNETKYWAVIVSIVDYELDVNDLNIPVNIMYDALRSAKNWDEDHILFIKNENATTENVLKGLDWLAYQVDDNDIAFFFFMGHGIKPKDDLNGDESDGKDEGIGTYERGGYIIDDLLNEKFNNISAQGLLVMIDCCHSAGMIEDDMTTKLSNLQNNKLITGITEELSGCGRVIIASTFEKAIALEVKGFGTILTLSLKQIIEKSKGDENKDGIVSAEETFVQLKKIYRRANLGLISSGLILLNLVKLTSGKATSNKLFEMGIASILLWEMFSYVVYGGIMIPYCPQIYDDCEGDLPFLEIN